MTGQRLTREWLSADGEPIELGDLVRAKDGSQGYVTGRFTNRALDGRFVPMIASLVHPGISAAVHRVRRPADQCVILDRPDRFKQACHRDEDEASLGE